MGVGVSSSDTEAIMELSMYIENEFTQNLNQQYQSKIGINIDQMIDSGQSGNVDIKDAVIIGSRISIDQRIKQSASMELTMALAASMNAETETQDFSEFSQSVDAALDKMMSTVADLLGASSSESATKLDIQSNETAINKTLINLSNQIFTTAEQNVSFLSQLIQDGKISIDHSYIRNTDIIIDQLAEFETNAKSEVSQRIYQSLNSEVTVKTEGDQDTSAKIKEEMETEAGISTAMLIAIAIIAIVVFLIYQSVRHPGKSGSKSKSRGKSDDDTTNIKTSTTIVQAEGAKAEEEIAAIKKDQKWFNIIMAIILVLDIIIIVIASVEYTKTVKPTLMMYSDYIDASLDTQQKLMDQYGDQQKVNDYDLSDSEWKDKYGSTARMTQDQYEEKWGTDVMTEEEYNDAINEAREQYETAENDMDQYIEDEKWTDTLVWTSVIGAGLIGIDIFGNCMFKSSVNEWKDVLNGNTKEMQELQQKQLEEQQKMMQEQMEAQQKMMQEQLEAQQAAQVQPPTVQPPTVQPPTAPTAQVQPPTVQPPTAPTAQVQPPTVQPPTAPTAQVQPPQATA